MIGYWFDPNRHFRLHYSIIILNFKFRYYYVQKPFWSIELELSTNSFLNSNLFSNFNTSWVLKAVLRFYEMVDISFHKKLLVLYFRRTTSARNSKFILIIDIFTKTFFFPPSHIYFVGIRYSVLQTRYRMSATGFLEYHVKYSFLIKIDVL